jgi:hypothetical protein
MDALSVQAGFVLKKGATIKPHFMKIQEGGR